MLHIIGHDVFAAAIQIAVGFTQSVNFFILLKIQSDRPDALLAMNACLRQTEHSLTQSLEGKTKWLRGHF